MKCCNFGENSDQLHLTSQFLSPPYINFDPEPLQWLEMNPANCGDLTNKIWRYQLIHMFAVLSSWISVKNPKNAGFFRSKMTQWPVVPWTWNPEKSQPHPHWASRCKTAKPAQPLALWIAGWIWLVVLLRTNTIWSWKTLRTGSHGPFSSMINLWSWSIAMFGSSSQIWAGDCWAMNPWITSFRNSMVLWNSSYNNQTTIGKGASMLQTINRFLQEKGQLDLQFLLQSSFLGMATMF